MDSIEKSNHLNLVLQKMKDICYSLDVEFYVTHSQYLQIRSPKQANGKYEIYGEITYVSADTIEFK